MPCLERDTGAAGPSAEVWDMGQPACRRPKSWAGRSGEAGVPRTEFASAHAVPDPARRSPPGSGVGHYGHRGHGVVQYRVRDGADVGAGARSAFPAAHDEEAGIV